MRAFWNLAVLAALLALCACGAKSTSSSSTSGSGSTTTSGSGSSGTSSAGSTGSTGHTSTTGHSGGSTGLTGTGTIGGTSTTGASSGTGGTTSGPPDSGFSWTCDFDGGPVGGQCSPECNPGFHCQGSACVLNGGSGPIQVTLRWGQGEDLDLHVIEPNCEVFYGNKQGCGGGRLDLDSNAGCTLDNVDIENVIYTNPDGGILVPPTGLYTVKVDFYANCDSTPSVPFEVVIRHGGQTDQYCLGFGSPYGDGGPAPADANQGDAGQFIATFTYP